MIILPEQYGYKSPKGYDGIENHANLLHKLESHHRAFRRENNVANCYSVNKSDDNYLFETSYFIGTDWLIENELSIYVEPKQNEEKAHVNYLKMLMDALSESENLEHLDCLFEIDFKKPLISIHQTEDLLSPLLIIQYLHILKKITQKGLQKSYYRVSHNLNAKVKGKVLVNANLKHNLFKRKLVHTYCQYEEFGINTIENKILKKALKFAEKNLEKIPGIEWEPLIELYSYIQPAFQLVNDEVQIEQLKSITPNPLYKEYEEALKLAILILKRYGFTISSINSTQIKTPPFWIDMSKLFELYVFGKLRKVFPGKEQVTYHDTFIGGKETDILIRTEGYECVVDCKYKPNYHNHTPTLDDKRQLAGYTRQKSVYNKLGLPSNKVVKGVIIYSHQDCEDLFEKEDIFRREISEYVDFYKLGIRLPIVDGKKINMSTF